MGLPNIEVAAKGAITVEVLVGQAHFGLFELWRWNPTGTEKEKIGEGVNDDDAPDVVKVSGTPAANDGRILHWKIRIAAIPTGPSQHFTASVMVRQDSRAVPNGNFSWSGSLGSAPIEIEGGARLRVS